MQLTGRDRHSMIKAPSLAISAIDSVPRSRRPHSDREALAGMLKLLNPSDAELELYQRTAQWILREASAAQCPASGTPSAGSGSGPRPDASL